MIHRQLKDGEAPHCLQLTKTHPAMFSLSAVATYAVSQHLISYNPFVGTYHTCLANAKQPSYRK
jgi:hypothetical protein